jgi:hypothetical protein
MQLKFELNTEPRKKYHMINRCDEKNVFTGMSCFLVEKQKKKKPFLTNKL